jgi:CHAT domain-containing protein/tetratricopeptide (TPR) repeat protein
MKLLPVWLGLVISACSAYSQPSAISQLLDSASALWFKDFDKTSQLLDRAERDVQFKNDSSSISTQLRILQLRVSSCQAFSRFQSWRENLDWMEKFLLDHQDKLGDEFHQLQVENELAKAMYYVEIHDDSQALPLLVHVQEKLRALPPSTTICHNLFLTTNYLAAIYQRRGEHRAAINQNLAGVPYYKCTSSGGGYDAIIYRNAALNYLDIRDFASARKYLNRAEEIIKEPLRNDPESLTPHALALYESQALLYEETGNSDSALLSISKALPLLSLRTVRDEFKGRISLSMANLYLDRKDFEQAWHYLVKAEGYFLKAGEQLPAFLADVYLVKAHFFEQQGQLEEALKYCNRSIEKLTVTVQPETSARTNQKFLSNKKLFNVLETKSRLEEKFYKKYNQVPALAAALATNRQAIALLDSTTIDFSLDEDRIILTETSYHAFERGIRINNLLYRLTGEQQYANQVFSLMEMSKSVLLLENLRVVNRFSGVSEEWIIREKEIKSEMLAVEKLLFQVEVGKTGDDHPVLRQRYADLKQAHSKLIDRLREQSPHYYKLRFDHAVVSPQVVQMQLLKPHEALVEFFIGDSVLAVAGFTSDQQYLSVKPLPPDFTDKLTGFRSSLINRADSGYGRGAHELYELLLKECLDELGEGILSLTIIPDGLLGYIPFEVLMSDREKSNTLNDRYAIRYAYSATYLNEQLLRKPVESKYFFAGFVASGNSPVPGLTRDTQLAALSGAEKEVISLAKLIRSKFKVFNPASKADFIKHASDFAVLHFAMHSEVNDENPMMSEMIFAETDSISGSLTAIDLYSMQLNSQLVVLSACNTGMGQLHRGEGIMSFSRAFAYAGVPSAVISLWKVPDEATSKIMVGFYRHLKTGKPKNRALQLARQEFIRNNPEYAHPFFWSGFILAGTAEPVEFPVFIEWYWIVAGLIVLAGAAYAARKRIMPARYLSGSS